ncbi:MAG TPA: VTT domain-containing protein [Patescibacteria group bacterium]
MFFSFTKILELLVHYRYFVLFPISIVEGPIVTVLGGFLASMGQLSVLWVFVVVVLGDLVGDSLYYFLGTKSRNLAESSVMKFLGITEERLVSLDEHFTKHTGKTLLLGKFTQAFGSVVLVAAGAARISYLKFILYNFIGTVPKSIILILVGYYFGQAYATIDRYLNLGTYFMIGAAVVLIGLYFLVIKFSKRFFK